MTVAISDWMTKLMVRMIIHLDTNFIVIVFGFGSVDKAGRRRLEESKKSIEIINACRRDGGCES